MMTKRDDHATQRAWKTQSTGRREPSARRTVTGDSTQYRYKFVDRALGVPEGELRVAYIHDVFKSGNAVTRPHLPGA
jgi:hypothetical protein